MNELFGLLFILGHLEDTTPSASGGTCQSVCTDSPWLGMYEKDKYARDRVMKSARLLLPYLKDGDTVLDVGCFTQEAKKYFQSTINYIGIDQKAYHKNSKVMDLNHGFEPIPCQGALCLETLEHLISPKDTLQSIYDSLPEGGILVASLPNEATLFHRIRCMLGTVDGDCFASQGKHLHLPSLKQTRYLLKERFEILREEYYISPSAVGSRQEWVGGILKLIPDGLHNAMARMVPSLFARGFIFLLLKLPSARAESIFRK